MRYRVTHATAYSYDDVVSDSLGIAHLVPRRLPHQSVLSAEVVVSPAPVDLSHDTDCYGNTVTYFQVTRPHRELTVEGRSDVEVTTPAYDASLLARAWERSRPMLDTGLPEAWRAVDLVLPSAGVEQPSAAAAYAAESLPRGRSLGDAVTDLMHRIHADFRYDATATTVTSPVSEVLDQRAGVCQDFAHLTIACLRSHGLAARYVSGYLATQPPPGRDRVVGADASHAWVEVWVPGSEVWLAVDPTNDQWTDDRYVTIARGRDYDDVPPVKGVIFSEATTSTLQVSVDVAPVDAVPAVGVGTAIA